MHCIHRGIDSHIVWQYTVGEDFYIIDLHNVTHSLLVRMMIEHFMKVGIGYGAVQVLIDDLWMNVQDPILKFFKFLVALQNICLLCETGRTYSPLVALNWSFFFCRFSTLSKMLLQKWSSEIEVLLQRIMFWPSFAVIFHWRNSLWNQFYLEPSDFN